MRAIRQFIQLESASGIVLVSAALLALIIDNSPLRPFYNMLLNLPLSIHLGVITLAKPLELWINDGLMTIFFLLVGLEIKREMMLGELNSWRKIALPGSAALGGMLAPALVYILLNWGDTAALRGWAIPTATDIAFSLGILALCGRRVPLSLKIFLTALAIFDDIGAIIIIAVFYTVEISWVSLLLALVCLSALIALNQLRVKRLAPYLLIGTLLWLSVLKSGVHATLAGVALAFTIPLQAEQTSMNYLPLQRLEKMLHPWVAFGVLPLFSFANAGVSFAGMQWRDWFNPLTLGIMGGLFIGKQVGVLTATWLAVKMGYAHLPDHANWRSLYGVALICGVGFTMSLFIGSLAFGEANAHYTDLVRLGVLTGSLLSGVEGYCVLCWRVPAKRRK